MQRDSLKLLRGDLVAAVTALTARVAALESAPKAQPQVETKGREALACGHNATPGRFGCPVCFTASVQRFGYYKAAEQRGVEVTTLADHRAKWRAENQQQQRPARPPRNQRQQPVFRGRR
jgi:hypothetical protein